MEIENISFSQFHLLLGDELAPLSEDTTGGCWYASLDRRVAASLFIDPKTEQWRYASYHLFRSEWHVSVSKGFDRLQEAEDALDAALSKLVMHRVSVSQAPAVRPRRRRKARLIIREAAEAGESPIEASGNSR
jgi:hypothetical protein